MTFALSFLLATLAASMFGLALGRYLGLRTKRRRETRYGGIE